MAKREVKSWITINGVHVPIFEGQTKEEAAKAAIERQKKRGPVSSDTRKKAVGDYVDKKRQYRDAYDKTEVFQRHHDRASNAEEREAASIKLKSAARDRDSKLQEFAKASDKVANLNKQKVRQGAEFKPKNTFENRKKLKDQIDAYVKAHPNPNAEDRNKVSAMRDRYNAMVKESAAKTKAKVNAELAEERKRDAQKKELEDLKREHYKLYKHDEDNISGRDEKLNALEKKISALEKKSAPAVNASGTMSPDQLAKAEKKRDALYDKQDHGSLNDNEKKELNQLENSISGHYQSKKDAGKSSTPEFKSRQEAEEYYKNKFAGVSSTYANKMAKKMGIEGRGKDKREALAKAYADRWETSNNINKDQDLKEKQIAANAAEKPGSKKLNKKTDPRDTTQMHTLSDEEHLQNKVNELNDLHDAAWKHGADTDAIKSHIKTVMDGLPDGTVLGRVSQNTHTQYTSQGAVQSQNTEVSKLYKINGKWSKYKDGSGQIDDITSTVIYNSGKLQTLDNAKKEASEKQKGDYIQTKGYGVKEKWQATNEERKAAIAAERAGGLSLEDAERKVDKMSPAQIRKLAGSQNETTSKKIPESQISISDSSYRFSNGKAPKGYGNWAFYIGNSDEPVFFSGSYAEAKKKAIKEAAKRGVNKIRVGS